LAGDEGELEKPPTGSLIGTGVWSLIRTIIHSSPPKYRNLSSFSSTITVGGINL
jgi:hypothetical protein